MEPLLRSLFSRRPSNDKVTRLYCLLHLLVNTSSHHHQHNSCDVSSRAHQERWDSVCIPNIVQEIPTFLEYHTISQMAERTHKPANWN